MPDYLKGSVESYLDAAAAGQPTPGGGSASALCGALGASMAAMAANFTTGKKQFAAVEPEVRRLLETIEAARRRLQELAQKDTEAYGSVAAALKMPRATEAEKSARKAAVAVACRQAMAVPLEAMRQCRGALVAARRLAELANPNLITDVGVAALLLDAGASGASLNVAINLPSVADPALARTVQGEMESALADCARLSEEIQGVVAASLGKESK